MLLLPWNIHILRKLLFTKCLVNAKVDACSGLDWPRIGNLVMQSSRDAGSVVRGILGQISPGSNVGSGGMWTLHCTRDQRGVIITFHERAFIWILRIADILMFLVETLLVVCFPLTRLICAQDEWRLVNMHVTRSQDGWGSQLLFCFVCPGHFSQNLFYLPRVMSHPLTLTQLWTH